MSERSIGTEAAENRISECPQCFDAVVQPRNGDDYCENCGWPDEDRTELFKLTCHKCKGVSVVKICQDPLEEFGVLPRQGFSDKDKPTFPHCPFCAARLGNGSPAVTPIVRERGEDASVLGVTEQKLANKLARAETDTKRLDWLADGVARLGFCYGFKDTIPSGGQYAWVSFGNGQLFKAETLREAIDAAMKGEPK